MTTVVLSPLRKQGDVSKIPTAPTAVLLQGSGTPPTATIPRTQGSSTSPTATLACTQGSDTSLPDTLAPSYTPHCTPGPSPCIYKREVQGRAGADYRAAKAAALGPQILGAPPHACICSSLRSVEGLKRWALHAIRPASNRILFTVPVTVASAERSFSKLKLLKNYLGSTMSQDWLNGLATLCIEKKLLDENNVNKIIDEFASRNVRRNF
jgi:hypothetical protein